MRNLPTNAFWKQIARHNIDRRDRGEITTRECVANGKAFRAELLPSDEHELLYVSEALAEYESRFSEQS